jgi:uncharacterized membrane protein YidH (DUF202 family)
MNGKVLIVLLVVVGVLAIGATLFRRSRQARVQRRRRKSHGRITSTAHQPSVQFSVRVPKD